MLNSSKLVTLIRCNSVWEADILRERLESAGIPAFTQGAESARSLSYVGAGLGGVKLQVSEIDLESARQVLDEDVKQHQTAGDWRCPRCDEPNEAAFDFCYSCSLPRGDAPAESIFEADADNPQSPADLGLLSASTKSARLETDHQRQNPYRMPDEILEPRQAEYRQQATNAKSMNSVMVWTILVSWIPLPLFALIAIVKLVKIAIESGGIPKLYRVRWFLLFAINAICLFLTSLIIYSFFQ